MSWQSFAYLLPVVPATVLAVSDLRHRTIPVNCLVAFGLCILLSSVFLLSVVTILYNILTNVLLLGWVFGGVWIYLKARYRRRFGSLGKYIGLGDVWVLILLTPLFDLPVYVVLLLCGFVYGLLYWIAVRIIARKETTIPLVALLSLSLIICLSYFFYISLP